MSPVGARRDRCSASHGPRQHYRETVHKSSDYFAWRSGERSRRPGSGWTGPSVYLGPVIVSPVSQPLSSLLVSPRHFDSQTSSSSDTGHGLYPFSSQSFLHKRRIDPVPVLDQKIETRERISILWQISHRLTRGNAMDYQPCVHAAQRTPPLAPKARQQHVCAHTLQENVRPIHSSLYARSDLCDSEVVGEPYGNLSRLPTGTRHGHCHLPWRVMPSRSPLRRPDRVPIVLPNVLRWGRLHPRCRLDAQRAFQ
jgi:hypothetical protein